MASEITPHTFSVSVIIPSYLRYDECVRAALSAKNQTHPPKEVIVTNDGTDNEKRNIFKDLNDDVIKYVEAPRTGKVGATRNYGIQHASGDWIALLDDDDLWLPNKLEDQLKLLKKHNYQPAILAGTQEVHHHSNQISFRPKKSPNNLVEVSSEVLSGNGGVHTSTIVAPKATFMTLPFNESINTLEDLEWLLVAGQTLKLAITPEILSRRFLGPREGLSQPGGFSLVLKWYERNNHLMSRDAQTYAVSELLAKRAGYELRFSVIPFLIRELKSLDALSVRTLLNLSLHFFIPQQARERIKNLKRQLKA